jgi:serine/threonine protein kinase
MGTLDYMAPEQALDFHKADIRADIYSLGCTFYYLLTGKPPFPEGTLTQKLLRHQQAQPTSVTQLRRDIYQLSIFAHRPSSSASSRSQAMSPFVLALRRPAS